MKVYDTSINPEKSRHCRSCKLYLNQFPLSDYQQNADVFWVGLSAVQIDENEKKSIPLSPSTRSGKLISDIENVCDTSVTFFKTNIVKCLPLNGNKIRYPELKEMDKCFPNLEVEIASHKPKLIFLLGRQVADFTLKKYGHTLGNLGTDFSYNTYTVGNIIFVPIHHPSYILVYKRKYVSDYIDGINRLIRSYINIAVCEAV